jgi:cytochrome b561
MPDKERLRHGTVTQTLHWLTALLVLVAFVYGLEGSEERVYSSARDFERQLHETLGLCVFALVVMRVIWRLVDECPSPVQVSRWARVSATAMQAVLYLLLFAIPLTASAGAWLEGHPLTLLAGAQTPPQFATSHRAGAILAEIHTWLGDAIMWLAGLHALAGLYHHFVLKDRVLVSMLPRWVQPR